MISIPPRSVPVVVVINDNPVAVVDATHKYDWPWTILADNAVLDPFTISPIDSVPLNGGDKLMLPPATTEYVFEPAIAVYSAKLIVIDVARKVNG